MPQTHKLIQTSTNILQLSLYTQYRTDVSRRWQVYLLHYTISFFISELSDVYLQFSESIWTHWSKCKMEISIHKQNLNIIYPLTKTRNHICQFVYILHLHLDRCETDNDQLKQSQFLLIQQSNVSYQHTRCMPITIPLSDNANHIYQLDNYWRWKTWHFELGQLYLTPHIIPAQTRANLNCR